MVHKLDRRKLPLTGHSFYLTSKSNSIFSEQLSECLLCNSQSLNLYIEKTFGKNVCRESPQIGNFVGRYCQKPQSVLIFLGSQNCFFYNYLLRFFHWDTDRFLQLLNVTRLPKIAFTSTYKN